MTSDTRAGAITLDFHADLYPREAIDRALVSFASLGEFRVDANGPYHRVTIQPAPAAVATLGHEFANFVLSLAVIGSPADEPKDAGPDGPDAT